MRIEPETMDRSDRPQEEPPAEEAPIGERAPVPAVLQFDYMQADFCGPSATGLRVKVRRTIPKHLRTLGVAPSAWSRWMDELAKIQQAEPYPSTGTLPLWLMQAAQRPHLSNASSWERRL